MVRRRVLAAIAVVAVLLIASFLIGTLYSPYGIGGLKPYGETLMIPRETLIAPEVAPTPTPMPVKAGDYGVEQRMIIYNAYISLETRDIEGVLARIRGLAEAYGGYVAGTSRSSYGVQARAEITIRVPQERFHEVVREIEGYGKVLDEHTSSEDVTERYIDLKARLENLKRQEGRLRDILDMAKTVEDVLKVEAELTRIRGDIESLQGEINYLERSAAMSVVTVSLVEPPPPFTPPGFDWGEILETALAGFFAVLRGLIILGVSLLPIIAIAAVAYHAYKRRRRRRAEEEGKR
ncbi:MAG: DUF4349 domain-containing protein [Candidatus Bathyarchaeia archaeon]|nr:DUF4349 domain-containing protein [Candidatus Bathyarchaeota archaeon]